VAWKHHTFLKVVAVDSPLHLPTWAEGLRQAGMSKTESED